MVLFEKQRVYGDLKKKIQMYGICHYIPPPPPLSLNLWFILSYTYIVIDIWQVLFFDNFVHTHHHNACISRKFHPKNHCILDRKFYIYFTDKQRMYGAFKKIIEGIDVIYHYILSLQPCLTFCCKIKRKDFCFSD